MMATENISGWEKLSGGRSNVDYDSEGAEIVEKSQWELHHRPSAAQAGLHDFMVYSYELYDSEWAFDESNDLIAFRAPLPDSLGDICENPPEGKLMSNEVEQWARPTLREAADVIDAIPSAQDKVDLAVLLDLNEEENEEDLGPYSPDETIMVMTKRLRDAILGGALDYDAAVRAAEQEKETQLKLTYDEVTDLARAADARSMSDEELEKVRHTFDKLHDPAFAKRDSERVEGKIDILSSNLARSLRPESLFDGEDPLPSPFTLMHSMQLTAMQEAISRGEDVLAASTSARLSFEEEHATTIARYEAVIMVSPPGAIDSDDEFERINEKGLAELGLTEAQLWALAARDQGLAPGELPEAIREAISKDLLASETLGIAKSEPFPAEGRAAAAKEAAGLSDAPLNAQEAKWQAMAPTTRTAAAVDTLIKAGRIPAAALVEFHRDENQLTAHRLLNLYGNRRFTADGPGRSAEGRQATRQETPEKAPARELGYWPNVNFPAASVTKIVPLVNRKTGQPVTTRAGKPVLEATVKVPEGVSLDGRDLSGWLFKQPVGEKAAKALEEGRPVNVSFKPGSHVGLFKYEGEGRARHPVADAPVIDTDDKVQAFCSAVAAARRAQETGKELAQAPALANPPLESQRAEAARPGRSLAEVTARQEQLFSQEEI